MKKIFVICGGTMNHVSPHFAFCAPAYGEVGLKIYNSLSEQIKNAPNGPKEFSVELIPTQMALNILPGEALMSYQYYIQKAGLKKLETNDDLKVFVEYLISHKETRSIILAAAVCDFEPKRIFVAGSDGEHEDTISEFGKNTKRLDSSKHYYLTLEPAEKVLPNIRQKRKDIFVVSFKTTAGVGRDETYRKGLLSLKKNSSNLVFANDIQDEINMIITPEEFPYEGKDRNEAIKLLADITFKRINLTFEDKTILKDNQRAFPDDLLAEGVIPQNWYNVMQYLFANKAFKPLPDTGKTSGHFGCRVKNKEYERITSERKINHNESFQRGMIPVYSYKNGELVVGGAKPSVGEKTQEMIYHELGDKIHSIIHFHCPLTVDSTGIIPQREQLPFECGSKECAINTVTGMAEIEPGIYAVHLKNHGPNIAFHESVSAGQIVKFIEHYWDLSNKTGGIIKAKEEQTQL